MSPWLHIALFWGLLTALAATILALLVGPGLRERRGLLLCLGLVIFALGGYALVGAPRLIAQQGFALAERASLAQEIVMLEASAKAEPDKPEHWRNLGNTQLRMGRPELAVEAYKQETLITQGDPDALLRLGKAQILNAGGRVDDDAARTFLMLQSLRPHPQAELFLGMHDVETGNRTKAEARFSALIRNPKLPAELRAAAQEQMKRLK